MKKYDLVTVAMRILGGDDHALDIEDIAMKCEELAPGSFAWRKYRNQINLELVGFAVRDAKKPKYGGLVSGSHAKGWRLTAPGVAQANKLLADLGSDDILQVQPTKHRNLDENRNNRELIRLRESSAFKEWQTSTEASKLALTQLLRINAYASQDSIDVKVARLAKVIGLDEEVDTFVNYIISRKQDLL
ncbi:MAG: hypothetical protein O2971_03675 [Proteobacteria bacterium]|nr:hypothetical protein [Pseudomonadota bacterium]